MRGSAGIMNTANRIRTRPGVAAPGRARFRGLGFHFSERRGSRTARPTPRRRNASSTCASTPACSSSSYARRPRPAEHHQHGEQPGEDVHRVEPGHGVERRAVRVRPDPEVRSRSSPRTARQEHHAQGRSARSTASWRDVASLMRGRRVCIVKLDATSTAVKTGPGATAVDLDVGRRPWVGLRAEREVRRRTAMRRTSARSPGR